jgi:serine O-acetyltransferase
LKKLYQILIGRSIRAVYIYKISRWLYLRKLKPFGSLFWSSNVMLHSIEISPLSKIGRNFNLAHTVGTVIGDGVEIGHDVTLYQNVTLGSKSSESGLRYPTIGNSVTIYPGSIVIGNVKVGDGATIGANSVVISDVPAGATVVGSPARIINHIKPAISQ